MMTVEIRINGKIKGRLEFVNREIVKGKKVLYSVFASQGLAGSKPFEFSPRAVLHIPDQGMMQLLANGLAAIGRRPKPWSVPK